MKTELEIPGEPQHIALFNEFITNQFELPEIVTSMQAVVFEAYNNGMRNSYSDEMINRFYVTQELLKTLTAMSILYMQNKK